MAPLMVLNMKRWTTIFLVYITLGAVLLIMASLLLPMMGLAGAEEEFIQPLARFTPGLFLLSAGAMALIVFDLKRQSRLAAEQSKRPIEEAENWSDERVIGAEIERPRL